MNKHQSGQSARISRSARRSLTEITKPTIGSAAEEVLKPAQHTSVVKSPIATWREKDSHPKVIARKKPSVPERTVDTQGVAARALPHIKSLKGAEAEEDKQLHARDDVISDAAKGAKDYRSWMFEQAKSNINAALGYASGLATLSLPADFGVVPTSRAHGPDNDSAILKPEKNSPAPSVAAAEYCAKVFTIMTANVNATLEYARQLGGIKSPGEFIELSTIQARKQVDLVITHAAELRALSRSFGAADIKRTSAKNSKPVTRKT